MSTISFFFVNHLKPRFKFFVTLHHREHHLACLARFYEHQRAMFVTCYCYGMYNVVDVVPMGF